MVLTAQDQWLNSHWLMVEFSLANGFNCPRPVIEFSLANGFNCPRPVIEFSLSNGFNKMISMDINIIERQNILHIIYAVLLSPFFRRLAIVSRSIAIEIMLFI